MGLTSVTILEEVTRIPKGAFKGCTSLTSVTIPSSVTKIEEEVFEGCNRLANVYCYADIIPNTDFGFFFSYMRSATLHVPTGSVNAYKVSYPWSEFGTIVPLTDEDAIIEVKVDEIEMEAICYDAQGSMIAKPQKGINIIRYSDGTSKKVLVK